MSADPVVANPDVARHCWVRCIPSHIGFDIRGAGDIPKGGLLVPYLEKDKIRGHQKDLVMGNRGSAAVQLTTVHRLSFLASLLFLKFRRHESP